MAYRPFTRLRAFVLLIAMGTGLVAPAVSAMAAPMGRDSAPMLSVSIGAHPYCLDCGGGNSSITMAPVCAAASCQAMPAILSLEFGMEQASAVAFALSTSDMGQGVAVRPDLAPPRSIHHS